MEKAQLEAETVPMATSSPDTLTDPAPARPPALNTEEVTEAAAGHEPGSTTPLSARSMRSTTSKLSLSTPDGVEMSAQRLGVLVQKIVHALETAKAGQAQRTTVDLRMAAEVIGELIRGEKSADELTGVSIDESVSDLLNILSACMDKAKVVLSQVQEQWQSLEEHQIVKSQAEAWKSRGEELTSVVEDAQSSKTVSAFMEGRQKLAQHLQSIQTAESGALGEVKTRGKRIIDKLVGKEGLIVKKGIELTNVVTKRVQARMGDVESTLETWCVNRGMDQQVVKEAITMARAEIESNKLQELLQEYEAAQKLSEGQDGALSPDATPGDGAALSAGQSDLVSKMLSQLQTVSERAGNSVKASLSPDKGLVVDVDQRQIMDQITQNAEMVETVKQVLQQSFQGKLDVRAFAGAVDWESAQKDALGYVQDQKVLAQASDVLKIAAENKDVQEYANKAVAVATEKIEVLSTKLSELSNIDKMTLEEVVIKLTPDARILETVKGIVEMILPTLEGCCTKLSIGKLVEIINNDPSTLERAATNLVMQAGCMTLEEVVKALQKREEVQERVMGALRAALPNVEMSLHELVVYLADPQAAEHVAVRLVNSARGLTLAQLVELSSTDTSVRQHALQVVNDWMGSEGGVADLTLSDLLGGVDDSMGAHVAEDIIKGADQILAALGTVTVDEKLGGMLDRCEEKLYTQLAELNMGELVRDSEAALTDEDARDRLVNRIKDSALDFFLEVLPNLPVPPIEGVKDGVAYYISDLDLSGVKIKKEDVLVLVGTAGPGGSAAEHKGDTTDSLLSITVHHVAAAFRQLNWSYEQTYFPYLKGEGKADAAVVDGEISLSFNLRLLGPDGPIEAAAAACDEGSSVAKAEVPSAPAPVPVLAKPAAPAPVGLALALEPTIASPSPSSGPMPAVGRGGSIDIDRRRTADVSIDTAKPTTPVICLRAQQAHMEGLELLVEGAALSWLYNLLASVFSALIKDYLLAALEDCIRENAGELLDQLNALITPATWPMVLRACNASLADLSPVTTADVFSSDQTVEREIELLFRKEGEHGLELKESRDGSQAVARVLEGSLAEGWCVTHAYPTAALLGAEVTAVNGYRIPGGEEGPALCAQWMATTRRPLSVAIKMRPGALKLARAQEAKERAAAAATTA